MLIALAVVGVIELGKRGADGGADLLCLCARGSVAGADGPQGLIGDDAVHGLLGREAGEGRCDLIGDIRLGQIMLALRKTLADADDRRDAVVEQDLRLGIDLQVSLAW